VPLGQDDDVIEALPPHASEESLAHRVHERRLDRGAQKANAGASGDAIERRTELVVAVADDEVRSLSERRRVAQLLRGPRPRLASDFTRREPMSRCTARSERIRARSSSLVPVRILGDRAADEGSRHHRGEAPRLPYRPTEAPPWPRRRAPAGDSRQRLDSI
jgi:hypothetical protein